jgi:hypothetical protein
LAPGKFPLVENYGTRGFAEECDGLGRVPPDLALEFWARLDEVGSLEITGADRWFLYG